MTIAYDNTPVSRTADPLAHAAAARRLSVLGMFCVLESFGLLLIGVRALSHPSAQALLGFSTPQQLQTMMFLQLVVGGHLLLLVTRTERWFFLPPFPAAKLFVAIVITQILAVAMCWFGWLVPADSAAAHRPRLALLPRLDVHPRLRAPASASASPMAARRARPESVEIVQRPLRATPDRRAGQDPEEGTMDWSKY